jgi:hypothetical protein
VRGSPAPATDPKLEATLTVTDPRGKETERSLTLRPSPDGTLAGALAVRAAGVDEAGTRTVRVRLRDGSGWETQHVQTVRFERVAPTDLR